MEILSVKNSQGWDERNIKWGGDFLQSWWWGGVNIKEGREVERFVLRKDGEILAHASIIERILPFGFKYWYLPHGPLGIDLESISKLLKYIIRISLERGLVFVHAEPLDNIPKLGKYKLAQNREPKQSLWVDLRESDLEKVLSRMHPKTRYNIKIALKRGVKIEESGLSDEVWSLFSSTGERGGFSLHHRRHYEKILNSPSSCAKLKVAKFNNKILAANLLIFYGDKVVYLHGASSFEYKEYMAPYLLHFEGMKNAIEGGFNFYDFWGIDSEKWPGVTRFKLGFGGDRIAYPEAYDLVLDEFRYLLYVWGRKLF